MIKQDEIELTSVKDLMPAVREADCVVIITNHTKYDYAAILEAVKLVVDTRNAMGQVGRNSSKVVKL